MSYTFPGGQTTYIPTLSLDLMVEFTRSEFPINRYVNRRKVDKMIGYYAAMKNDNQVRIVGPEQFYWADGSDAPQYEGTGTDSFTFTPYTAKRYAYVERLGELGVQQGSWDVLGQASRMRFSQGMTARSYRVAQAITTSGNYPTANYAATAGAISGSGAWASATSSNLYIKNSLLYMQQKIVQQTNGVVQPSDLRLVINPNTAITVATSAEFVDFLKQSPDSLGIWEGGNYNQRFGLPARIYGVELVIDDTVYTSSAVGTSSPTYSYTLGDNKAVMLTKQNAVTPSVGSAFSTFEILEYTPGFEVFVYNDVRNRRHDLQVVENAAEVVFAGQSGFLIANTAA
jgi:hypothetical protein